MTTSLLLSHLQQRIGLSPDALSPTVVPQAVERRMRALGLDAIAEYEARVLSQPTEFQALVDEIVVPETWFFRGGDLFFFLADQIRQRRTAPPFRVLSVPCSTGEEPYSLAIALWQFGVPPADWWIDGVDISTGNLDRAQRGCYQELSFRQMPSGLRERYFRQSTQGQELDASVRSSVHYRVGNLLDPLFLAGEQPYHLIFCRNLFIYLHPQAREEAFARLLRLLSPDGLLCLGHAEPLPPGDRRFRLEGPQSYFLYRRVAENRAYAGPLAGHRPVPAVGSSRPGVVPPMSPAAVGSTTRGGSFPVTAAPTRPTTTSERPRFAAQAQDAVSPDSHDPLDTALQMADRGDVAAAQAICQAEIDRGKPSAAAFSLLGVIHQARQDTSAAKQCFQKALYLDPEHEEALTHLMLLYQLQGDETQADRLRQRLRRLGRGDES